MKVNELPGYQDDKIRKEIYPENALTWKLISSRLFLNDIEQAKGENAALGESLKMFYMLDYAKNYVDSGAVLEVIEGRKCRVSKGANRSLC